MWTDIATGVTRAVAPAVVAWLVAKWGLPEDMATQLWGYAGAAIASIVTLVAAVWSARVNYRRSKEAAGLREEVRRMSVTTGKYP